MMMPKIIDVIEFVKDGQNDRKMAQMLRDHPDGQELLKQARFICKMLENEADSRAAVGDEMASFGSDNAEISDFSAMRSENQQDLAEENGSFFESAARMESPEYSSSISRMIEQFGRDGEDLGSLVFEDDGEQSLFAYEPSAFGQYKLDDPKLTSSIQRQVATKNIRILGNDISVFVPKSVPAGDLLTIRVTFGLREIPAERFPFLYMPESGPFLELHADDNGVIELPMSDLPGTLRIERPTPQFLHIKSKIPD